MMAIRTGVIIQRPSRLVFYGSASQPAATQVFDVKQWKFKLTVLYSGSE
jgi:hypothetical protein